MQNEPHMLQPMKSRVRRTAVHHRARRSSVVSARHARTRREVLERILLRPASWRTHATAFCNTACSPLIAAEKVPWRKLCNVRAYTDKRLHLRCRPQKPVAIMAPVQWTDADRISCDQRPAPGPIPESECEDAVESVQERTRVWYDALIASQSEPVRNL